MKKVFALILVVVCLYGKAQEVLLEPSFVQERPFVFKTFGATRVQLNDTLGLPFFDDFSTNKLAPMITGTESAYQSIYQYKYESVKFGKNINGKRYSLDTSYTLIVSDALKIANPPADTLKLFDYEHHPAQFIKSIPVWNYYNLVDSLNNGSYDTLFYAFMANDSALFYLLPPAKNLWTDHLVYINSQYPLNLPSVGAATFDAVDHYGALYLQGNTSVFSADSLSSKPLDLSTLSPSDQVFLSFMIQKAGIGDAPESNDHLILQFKDSAMLWTNVWTSAGELNLNNDEFRNISLAVSQSKYFYKGFQFRFVNYASLPAELQSWQNNVDHWHLDYVVLDKNRSVNDNYIKDVCFTYPPSTLINGYHAIPWKHYINKTSLTKTSSLAFVKNTGTMSANVEFKAQIFENSSLLFQSAAGNSFSVPANTKHDFTQNYSPFVFLSSEPNIAQFTIQYELQSDQADLIPSNDTCTYEQLFDSYYAYDDGSAEAGYGLNTSNSKFAYFFDLLASSDTLTAFDIYFNRTKKDANNNASLKLMIWANNNGLPGDVLYSTQIVNPKKSDSLNCFLSYKLEKELLVSQDFFIGWQQMGEDYINIGLDRNTNNMDKMFFNVNNTWNPSQISGSVMLRPRFGKLSFLSTLNPEQNLISLYPNPTSDVIYINIPSLNSKVILRDLSGKVVLEANLCLQHQSISLVNLSSGTYLLSIISSEGEILGHQKIIKQN